VAGTDPALHAAAADDTVTGTGHAAVEVHAVDTDRGVILDTKIDVLADTEAEVASLAEVALAELVLLDLEATLKNLLGLLTFPPMSVPGSKHTPAFTEGIDLTLGPRMVTWTAIFSLRRIPKFRTVYRALPGKRRRNIRNRLSKEASKNCSHHIL